MKGNRVREDEWERHGNGEISPILLLPTLHEYDDYSTLARDRCDVDRDVMPVERPLDLSGAEKVQRDIQNTNRRRNELFQACPLSVDRFLA